MTKKRFLPILLGIWPYLVLVLMGLLANEENQYYGLELLILSVLTAIVYILNIANACIGKQKDIKRLALMDMLIKLIHIPFYLLVFVIGAMALVVMVVPVFVFISPFIVIMLAVIDFFLMLTSSAYGINALIRARKDGIISSNFMVLHIVMHLCFVLDIVSAIIVFLKLRKVSKKE